MSADFHADYVAAPAEHQWGKPLHDLMVRLREGAWAGKGRWCWYVLPAGALVSMRVHPPEPKGQEHESFVKELRISRRGIKSNNPALFLAEANTFKKHLGCVDWSEPHITFEPDTDTIGTFRAVALIVELAPLGHTKPAPNLCARCGKPAAHEPQYKEDLCNNCATEMGRKDADARNAEHQRSLL